MLNELREKMRIIFFSALQAHIWDLFFGDVVWSPKKNPPAKKQSLLGTNHLSVFLLKSQGFIFVFYFFFFVWWKLIKRLSLENLLRNELASVVQGYCMWKPHLIEAAFVSVSIPSSPSVGCTFIMVLSVVIHLYQH